ncbi:enoyl-CoA hydratase/isomerase family protein [Sphingomonas desiccabilis]|uniref:3-hydroxyisobutyryl-CoA hydrolase n=1 Tax=Sphingomonas desiccabilis TaxID=429134 RepID=A0A4Q2IUA4_9SPHN|nr:enoyl-CoA hydratase/isomerase family protein [Sphingomonas desiccabilis]MBB3910985.1 enoyl-CoA hydratase [Sphingomonas desiccabilis]RXZ32195.1 enoyl-CoA hydratase/isomerase family protein [Sphingomonas desiccabilis]
MTEEVRIEVDGKAGRIRLDRPRALHALNEGMCGTMLAALEDWREDAAVEIVLIDHAEGRGFCAGGDVRRAAESGKGDGVEARAFFATEYRLNHRLFTYAKPVVAFMDGVVMGGGVGISQPARFRIATENTLFAMPETAIGLFPDVGGGWYLSRLRGRVGQYLALTGARIGGAECHALGLATHYIPADRLETAKTQLGEAPQEAGAILDALSDVPPSAAILEHREAIDRLFASDRLEDILATLEADGGVWATEQLSVLRNRSPLSMKVALKLLLEGATMPTFEDEMRQEYAVAAHIVQRPDFAEGVRAVLIDKDNAPRWDPATPEGVTDHMIDRIFAPLDAEGEWSPQG